MMISPFWWENMRSLLHPLYLGGILLLIVMSLIIAFDLDAFLDDNDSNSNEDPIAKLVFCENVVKTRKSNVPAFYPIELSDNLYPRDYLFTDADSNAILKFNDGSKIDVAEKSLIIVEKTEGSSGLSLMNGSVKSEGTLKIKLKGGRDQLYLNGKAQISTKKGGDSLIKVLDGSAVVAGSGQQKKLTIKKNQWTRKSASGRFSGAASIPIILRRPVDQAVFNKTMVKTIEFSWTLKSNITSCRFEIARDMAFKKNILRATSTSNRVTVATDLLAPGRYFWRIVPNSSASGVVPLVAESRSLKIDSFEPPRVFLPTNNQKYLLTGNKASKQILINFDFNPKGYPAFHITIYSQRNPKKPLLDATTTKAPYKLIFKRSGTYYWRICGVRDKYKSPWSQKNYFIIEDQKLPEAPVAILPKNETFYDIKDLSPKIQFKWTKVKGAIGFVFELSGSSKFLEQLFIGKPKTPNLDFSPRKYGTYYWRVRSLDTFGRATQYSKPRRFSLIPHKPILLTPKGGAKISVGKDSPVSFNWHKGWQATRYLFQLSHKADFTSIIFERSTQKNKLMLKNPSHGTFYWRVKAFFTKNISTVSRVNEISFLSLAHLAPPNLYKEYQISIERK